MIDVRNIVKRRKKGSGGGGAIIRKLTEALTGEVIKDDLAQSNGLAVALTDSATEQMWSGERTTADGAPIKDGVAFVSALKGKTMKVNQMYSPIMRRTTTINQDVESGGIVRIYGTPSVANPQIYSSVILKAKVGDVFFTDMKVISGSIGNALLASAYGVIRTAGIGAQIKKVTDGRYETSGSSGMLQFTGLDTSVNYDIRAIFTIINLTDIFGSGNEPSTPDEFAQRYGRKTIADLPYIPPQETNLQSFAPNAVVSKGRNLFDMDSVYSGVRGITKTEDGYSGTLQSFQVAFNKASNNPIWVNTNKRAGAVCITTKVNASSSATPRLLVIYTDGSTQSIFPFAFKDSFEVKSVFTNASKVVDRIHHDYGVGATTTMVIAEFLIAFSDDVIPYTPYREPSRLPFDLTTIKDADGNPLFPDGELKSAGSVHDLVDYANNVAVRGKKVIGRVNLGELAWSSHNADRRIFKTSEVPFKMPSLTTAINVQIVKYRAVSRFTSWVNGDISNYDSLLTICDTDYATPAEFKSAMQGVYLEFELATPIEGEAPITKAWYPVQNNGSEEAITDTIVPFNGEIRYRGESAQEMVEQLNEML